MIMSDELNEHILKQVYMGNTGLDIMHGELKNLMYECETDLANVSELQDMPEYKYLSGRLDALTDLYTLTYNLSFAISEREGNK